MFSWCDKRKVKSIIAPIPRQNQRRNQNESIKIHNNITTMHGKNVYPGLEVSSSDDNRFAGSYK